MFLSKKEKEKYQKEIASLKHEVADLRDIVKTQELIKLRSENARLKEIEQLVHQIGFKLKDVAYLDEEDVVLVKYEMPYIKVGFNDKGEPIKNDMFYAINKLQLISMHDMKKIQAVLEEVKKTKK